MCQVTAKDLVPGLEQMNAEKKIFHCPEVWSPNFSPGFFVDLKK